MNIERDESTKNDETTTVQKTKSLSNSDFWTVEQAYEDSPEGRVRRAKIRAWHTIEADLGLL